MSNIKNNISKSIVAINVLIDYPSGVSEDHDFTSMCDALDYIRIMYNEFGVTNIHISKLNE